MSRDASPVQQPDPKPRSEPPATGREKDYPVREYIGGMCMELAQMARWDGDERLAVLLEAAAGRAHEPRPDRPEIETVERVARRA
jgi:hypothetical protein